MAFKLWKLKTYNKNMLSLKIENDIIIIIEHKHPEINQKI